MFLENRKPESIKACLFLPVRREVEGWSGSSRGRHKGLKGRRRAGGEGTASASFQPDPDVSWRSQTEGSTNLDAGKNKRIKLRNDGGVGGKTKIGLRNGIKTSVSPAKTGSALETPTSQEPFTSAVKVKGWTQPRVFTSFGRLCLL